MSSSPIQGNAAPAGELEEVLARGVEWLAAGREVALATVVRTWGSSPRPLGSRLIVADQGDFTGSISGGCVESAVVDAAQALLAGGAPRLLEFGVSDGQAWEVGLSCGGEIDVYVQRLRPQPDLLQRLLQARAARQTAVWVTFLETGDHALIEPEAPVASVDEDVLEIAQQAVQQDRSMLADTAHGRVFVHVLTPPLRVVVVGAVHIAQSLCQMARLVGFDAIVVDPRRGYATEARFPGVPLLCRWPGEALSGLRLDARCAVVTLTHDPKLDEPALVAALEHGVFYVGALGSRRTHAARLARLRAQSVPEEALARIHGPVGLDLGARSAAEIAVAIIADLVQHLRVGQR